MATAAHRIDAAILKTRQRVSLETFGTGFQIASIHQQGIGREITEQRRQSFAEENGCQYSILAGNVPLLTCW
ncbi:hypothetical protein ACNKHP_02290 [Shigella boydii]